MLLRAASLVVRYGIFTALQFILAAINAPSLSAYGWAWAAEPTPFSRTNRTQTGSSAWALPSMASAKRKPTSMTRRIEPPGTGQAALISLRELVIHFLE